jgi:ubiquinone/menaquinone biosynthesis C-methylase UbiE
MADTIERADVSGFQLSGDAASLYERYGQFAMGPWTDDLIVSARCRDGDRVLDVACGTGLIAKRVNTASGVTCKITGIDLNEHMLNVARQDSSIDWRLGDVGAMPFPPGAFDVVLCQQGLQFFPDRQTAMQEMARVLAPGGRLSLNVWGPLDRQVYFMALFKAVDRFIGDDAAKTIASPYTLTTKDELRALAIGAGFKNITVRFEQRTIRAEEDIAQFTNGLLQATPMASQFLALGNNQRTALMNYVADQLADYVDDAGMAVPQENHFLFAVR